MRLAAMGAQCAALRHPQQLARASTQLLAQLVAPTRHPRQFSLA